MKFETMLPGNPKPGDYRITNISPYKIHQRCAEKFRVGRFLLVADAAHICNPFGGLGLTGGMVDAGNLADCIIGVAEGIADPSIFDKYDEIRREMWHKIINPVSSNNLLRMHSQDPEKALENDEFLKTLSKAEKDPGLMEQMIVVYLPFVGCCVDSCRELTLFNMISPRTILNLGSRRRFGRPLELREIIKCERRILICIAREENFTTLFQILFHFKPVCPASTLTPAR